MLNHRIRGEIPRTSGTYREITQPVSQHGLRAAAGAAALGSWWLSIMSVCLFNYSIICRNVNMSSFLQAQSSASKQAVVVSVLWRGCRKSSIALLALHSLQSLQSNCLVHGGNWIARTFVSDHRLASSQSSHCSLPNVWKMMGGPWHEASLSICIIECITKYYKILQTYA